MTLQLTNFLNSLLVNPDPFSATITSGMLWVDKMDLNLLIVHSDDVEGTISTSSHLEWASWPTGTLGQGKVPHGQYECGSTDVEAISMGGVVHEL